MINAKFGCRTAVNYDRFITRSSNIFPLLSIYNTTMSCSSREASNHDGRLQPQCLGSVGNSGEAADMQAQHMAANHRATLPTVLGTQTRGLQCVSLSNSFISLSCKVARSPADNEGPMEFWSPQNLEQLMSATQRHIWFHRSDAMIV